MLARSSRIAPTATAPPSPTARLAVVVLLAVITLGMAPRNADAADLAIRNWRFGIEDPARVTRNVTVSVELENGDYYREDSNALAVELRLATAPHGRGGKFWRIARGSKLNGIAAGFVARRKIADAWDPHSLRPGNYHVIVVVSEYSPSAGGYVERAASTSRNHYTVRPRPKGLELHDWNTSLPKPGDPRGIASVRARVTNDSSKATGGLQLELRLQTSPYGKRGKYFTITRTPGLHPLAANASGERRSEDPFDWYSLPPGEYYVVCVLAEYTGEGRSGYVIRAGSTGKRTVRVPKKPGLMKLGAWRSRIGGGQASLDAEIRNQRHQRSGSLRLDLRLSTAPHDQPGKYWLAAQGESLDPMGRNSDGNRQVSRPFDVHSVPAGTYYVVAVLSEYSSGGYVVRDSATSSTTFTVPKRRENVRFGRWSWSLPGDVQPPGEATATVAVTNPDATRSDRLGVELRLSTAPYGQPGRYWTVLARQGLAPVAAGSAAKHELAGPWNPYASVPPGTYHVQVVLTELTESGYVFRDAETDSKPFTVPKRKPLVDLEIGKWEWKIAKPDWPIPSSYVEAEIENDGRGAESGNLSLELRLSTQPYGKGGSYYQVARADTLEPLARGKTRRYRAAMKKDLYRIPAGTYFVVAVVREYTGKGEDGYSVRDGTTSKSTYTVPERPPHHLVIVKGTYKLPKPDWPTPKASVKATVKDLGYGEKSGTIAVELRLSTKPHGKGGRYYTLLRETKHAAFTAGEEREIVAEVPYEIYRIPAGTYYPVIAIGEYTGADDSDDGYTWRYGITGDPHVVPEQPSAELVIGKWRHSALDPKAAGPVTASASIRNLGDGKKSGTVEVELRLATQRHGKGGTYYSLAKLEKQVGLKGGEDRRFELDGTFDPTKYDAGNYYVTIVVREFTGEGKDRYATRYGLTARARVEIP